MIGLRRLVLREIAHRSASFLLALASVVVAVASVSAALIALEGHDVRTEAMLASRLADIEKRHADGLAASEARVAALKDQYRKITKNMGYNVLILPKDQNLADFHADDYARKYMPESHATRLAGSRIVTINHLLPSLTQKIHWPERERTIILIGTKGQVPIAHRDPKKPIQQSVPPGAIVLGHELARVLDLEAGDDTVLLGREFEVSQVHGARGTKDDITAWIHLDAAQELLGKDGLINGILALECNCPGDPDERLTLIRNEILSILPDVKVINFHSKALARVEARRTAEKEAVAAIEAEKQQNLRELREEETSRAALKEERVAFASTLVPVVLLGACLAVGLLALGNARDRASEVGILRAIGLGKGDILRVFLARAAIVGVFGALAGLAAGVVAGSAWAELGAAEVFDLPGVPVLAVALAVAPLLCVIATWIPATVAARQDPAAVLRRDS